MRFQFLVWLLLVTFVWAQNKPAQAPPPSAPNAPSAPEPQAAEPQVGSNDTVITLKGVCSDSSLQGDACKTVITKAQFDKIADE